jgi:uncharacterized protein
MRTTTWLATTAVLLLAGCGDGAGDAADAAAAREAENARRTYEQEILAWRDERVARLTRPDGWLSLVGMHWLERGSTFVGAADDNGTRLAVGPPQIGMVTLHDDGTTTLRLHPDAVAHVTIDGAPPPAGDIPLVADADAPEGGGPTVVGLTRATRASSSSSAPTASGCASATRSRTRARASPASTTST